MSKRNAAPTFGWVASSQIYKILAIIFIVTTILWAFAIWSIRYSINRDCENPYWRELSIFGYWIRVEAGSEELGCPRTVE